MKIGSCEIVGRFVVNVGMSRFKEVSLSLRCSAHHKDESRIDIVIPKGRHIYVRACTRAERQKWLVALGSAKQEMVVDSRKTAFIFLLLTSTKIV